jgi:hypothetical protein
MNIRLLAAWITWSYFALLPSVSLTLLYVLDSNLYLTTMSLRSFSFEVEIKNGIIITKCPTIMTANNTMLKIAQYDPLSFISM